MQERKLPISARIEEALHRRIEIVSQVDRRSMADVVAECVRRALPTLEQELQQPRLTPTMFADLRAGKPMAEVLASAHSYSITPKASTLNEAPPKPRK